MTKLPVSRRKRMVIATSIAVVALLCVVAFFLPYLLKRYIEQNSETWIDHRITLARSY